MENNVGGPSQSNLNTQNSIAQQQLSLAQQSQTKSDAEYQQQQQLQAPAIDFYKGLAGGNNADTQAAIQPVVANISGSYNAAKQNIMNTIQPGAARDQALAQLEQSKATSIGSAENSAVTGAYDKLANLGAGIGSFSLQELGASLSGFGGAANTNQSVLQAQAQQKASTMGFLGSIIGGAGSALSGSKLFGH